MSEGQREHCLRLLLLLVRGGRHVPEAHVAHVAHKLPAHDRCHRRLHQRQIPCAPGERTYPCVCTPCSTGLTTDIRSLMSTARPGAHGRQTSLHSAPIK